MTNVISNKADETIYLIQQNKAAKQTDVDATNAKIVDASSLEKSIVQNFYNPTKASLMLAGIDSLTNRALNSSWLDTSHQDLEEN
ncbi:hypothetical protein M3612_17890 [Niallia taxi]|uniref:hypothetical protein n=1 Tax=Niallia taxi TaxID=2499688 RepID=UPI00203CC632|nr:hypothetical protein [Niallia taxi]MCM3216359.1 hypothetical protein [Niallia taxi]